MADSGGFTGFFTRPSFSSLTICSSPLRPSRHHTWVQNNMRKPRFHDYILASKNANKSPTNDTKNPDLVQYLFNCQIKIP